MKFKWIVVGAAILILALSLMGCVSKSQYETMNNYRKVLQAENASLQTELEAVHSELDSLQADHSGLQADLEETQNELTKIQEKELEGTISYFDSSMQLADWLGQQKDLQTSTTSSIYEDYKFARELQMRALKEGYIVNVYVMDNGEGGYWVWCDTYLSAGDIYYWTMLDFNAIEWYGNLW